MNDPASRNSRAASKTSPTVTQLSLSWVFKEFEQRKVPYCVLRNYELLPYQVGNDIDIVIDGASSTIVEGIVRDCAERFGWTLRRRGKSMYFILYRLAGESWEYIRLDIVTRVTSGGVQYSPTNLFTRLTVLRDNNLRTPTDTLEVFHVVMHSLLGPAYNQERYIARMDRQIAIANIRWNDMGIYLHSVLPKWLIQYALNRIRRGRVGTLYRHKWFLKAMVLAKLGYGHTYVARGLTKWISRLIRFVRPPGLFVVLIGPDGVGKSTAARGTASILRMFHRRVMHLHLGFRPGVLPGRKSGVLATIGGREKRGLGRRGMAKRRQDDVMGVLRLLYYTLDYIVGYFIRIRPVLWRNGVVLAERYYYDYVAGFRKNPKVVTAAWLIRCLFRCMPKPKMVIVLHNTPEAIRDRRDELAIGEIRYQLDQYERLGSGAKYCVRIMTDKEPDQVATEIADRIMAASVLK